MAKLKVLSRTGVHVLPAVGIWTLAWLLMLALDEQVDLANLALVLVLAAALSGLWLTALTSTVVCAVTVMAFNWQFVPPRGTFSVDIRQHAWLLLSMMTVGSLVAWLMARQRALADAAKTMASHAELHRLFQEQLRDESSVSAMGWLARALHQLTRASVVVHLVTPNHETVSWPWPDDGMSPETQACLNECTRSGESMTLERLDVHGNEAVTLPLRGQAGCLGACLMRLPKGHRLSPAARTMAQTLCDHAALHCERALLEAHSQRVLAQAQTQQWRNTLLAAISHDYRTPLATILSAASSLLSQSGKLSAGQATTLAQTVVDEVDMLITMTENTLQLARLDATGTPVPRDWESLEELVGTAVSRVRKRYPDVKVNLRMAADLPLFRCNAELLVQLLNNLVDNAVKHGGIAQTIEIMARPRQGHLLLAVADRGPGMPWANTEQMFQAWVRGDEHAQKLGAERGSGLGLALCRAIVVAHGGTLQSRRRQRGGTSMECLFPIEAQPVSPTGDPLP